MSKMKLLAVGDISLIWRNDYDPFKYIKPILSEKDILFGNLETVLSVSGKKAEKAVLVNTDPGNIIYIKDSGFDIVNLANNHILDLGVEGFNNTLDVLNSNKIKFIGVGSNKYTNKYPVIEKNDIRLGFLGYYSSGFVDTKNNIFINEINEKKIASDIQKIKENCDVVIVSLHWGVEKVFYPSPKQIFFAHNLIEIGANVVLGHHPHVLQGIEEYKDGIIIYSLGNFQFVYDKQECHGKDSKRTNQTIVLSLDINKKGVEHYDIIPVKINDHYCPILPDVSEEKEILEFIYKISKPIKNGEINKKFWFEEISAEYIFGNYKSWIIRVRRYGIKHFMKFLKWLVSPFNIRCYIGFMRRKLKRYDKSSI
jgi:hypothetical protein